MVKQNTEGPCLNKTMLMLMSVAGSDQRQSLEPSRKEKLTERGINDRRMPALCLDERRLRGGREEDERMIIGAAGTTTRRKI